MRNYYPYWIFFCLLYVFPLTGIKAQDDCINLDWKTPTTFNVDYLDVAYVTNNIIVVVGDQGAIIRSTDQGANWSLIDNPSQQGHSIHFVSPTTGFIIGENVLMRTDDQGVTWAVVQTFQANLTGIHFASPQLGFITSNQGIFRSPDGGASWLLNPNLTLMNGVHFPSTSVGYATGQNNRIFRTADGGITWTLLPTPTGTTSRHFTSVHFINNDIGYVGAQITGEDEFSGQILKTINAGTNWQVNPMPSVEDIFVMGNNVMVAGLQGPTFDFFGELYLSEDAGNTYELVYSGYPVFGVAATSLNNAMTVGMAGTIASPTQNGRNWDYLSAPLFENSVHAISAMSFLNENTGVAVSNNLCDVCGPSGAIFRTTDAGTTWSASLQTNNAFTDLHFTNSNIGHATTLTTTYRTTNGGVDWTAVQGVFSRIFFPTANIGYGIAGNQLQKSNNGAQSWSNVATPGPLVDIYFTTQDIGYAITAQGVFSTNNGAASWSNLGLTATTGFTRLFFLNNQVGFVLSQNTVYRTQNGGANWQTFLQTDAILTDVKAFDASTIYVTTENGLYYTNDGGQIWHDEQTLISGAITALSLGAQFTAFAATDAGGILQANTCPDIPLSVDLGKHRQQVQIFPNPNNGIFRARLTNNDVVKARIVNMMGETIRSLEVRGEANIDMQGSEPGIYMIMFDGAEGSFGQKIKIH